MKVVNKMPRKRFPVKASEIMITNQEMPLLTDY
jgi:hypothetical protein